MAPRGRPTRLNPDVNTNILVTNTIYHYIQCHPTSLNSGNWINEGSYCSTHHVNATQKLAMIKKPYIQERGPEKAYASYIMNALPDFLKCQRCELQGQICYIPSPGNALTWWNSHVKTTTPEAAHAMPWRTLKKMMTDKYCPRGEIKKTREFLKCGNLKEREEIDQVEKYVGGLPDTIHGSVMATKPKTMQDAIEFVHRTTWTNRSNT
ncbi:hypothetical protein Tco_0562647 [Tanacetum coccineum]